LVYKEYTMSTLVRDLAIGAAIGYGANRMMDQVTGWYLQQQSAASRQREQELVPGGTPVRVGQQLAAWVGRTATEAEAMQIGSVVHRSLGMTYGLVAAALVRDGTPPLQAGLLTGITAFLVVDEGLISAVFTPPPWAYPLESHVRGALGHVAYGLVVGTGLTVAQRLGALRP
jgi:hypothetical protein